MFLSDIPLFIGRAHKQTQYVSQDTNMDFDSSMVEEGELDQEAQTNGTRHSPPPLTLTGPNTTVTEDLKYIRLKWPRVERQRLPEELKQILLNLLKTYDTKSVASFIRTEVLETKQLTTKSPYKDVAFRALFNRLEYLKNSNKEEDYQPKKKKRKSTTVATEGKTDCTVII